MTVFTNDEIDKAVRIYRQKVLATLAEREDIYVSTVVGQGVRTPEEALRVLDEQRPGVLDSVDAAMNEIRLWFQRGGTNCH